MMTFRFGSLLVALGLSSVACAPASSGETTSETSGTSTESSDTGASEAEAGTGASSETGLEDGADASSGDESGDGTQYDDNEDGEYQDMLTPQYYLDAPASPFRDEVNRFVHHARLETFVHPVLGSGPATVDFTLGRGFGDGVGPGGAAEHHPAYDFHVGDQETDVTIYAAHGGVVSRGESDIYQDFLTITTPLVGEADENLGRLVTLYAHLNVDADLAEGLAVDGASVEAGQVISQNLNASTLGGPHLHFEIRYYRPGDAGDETFYGSATGPVSNPQLTESSAGPWSYGSWDPNVGYGYAHPANHGVP